MLNFKSRINFLDWRTVFCLWSIQGFIACVWLILLPTNTKSEVVFGFSAARLAILGSILFLTIGSISLYLRSGIISFRSNWLNLDQRPLMWDFIFLTSLSVSLFTPVFISVLLNLKGNVIYAGYATRLSPLAFWIMLSGIELAIFLSFNRWIGVAELFREIKPVFRNIIFVLLALLVRGGLIGVTKVGVSPDRNW